MADAKRREDLVLDCAARRIQEKAKLWIYVPRPGRPAPFAAAVGCVDAMED